MNFYPVIKKQTISTIEFQWNKIPNAEVYRVEKYYKNDNWKIVYW